MCEIIYSLPLLPCDFLKLPEICFHPVLSLIYNELKFTSCLVEGVKEKIEASFGGILGKHGHDAETQGVDPKWS